MTESSQDTPESAGATRRALLLGVGAIGATGLLAACGSGDPAPTPTVADSTGSLPPLATSTASAGPTEAAADPNGIPVSDVPVGGGAVFADRRVVVTQPTAGTFKAFEAVCTHEGCIVGDVSNGRINCPCHGSQFSITDGAVVRGPASRRLPAKTATVNGNTISVT